MIEALTQISGGVTPTEFLLAFAVVALSAVVAVLWSAVLRKDRRLSEVHDRQTEAFRQNVCMLSEVKTLMSILISERRS